MYLPAAHGHGQYAQQSIPSLRPMIGSSGGGTPTTTGLKVDQGRAFYDTSHYPSYGLNPGLASFNEVPCCSNQMTNQNYHQYGASPSFMFGATGAQYQQAAHMETTVLAPPPQESYRQPSMHRDSMHRDRDHGCQENVADDECLDRDQCGNDVNPPNPKGNPICGVDCAPYLPYVLYSSTILGGICMLFLQVPLLSRAGCMPISQTSLFILWFALYGGTLGFMYWCAKVDPGQIKRENISLPQGERLMSQSCESFGSDPPLPARARRMWQYSRALRRYDHYCRWVTNGIALMNHREFYLMLCGLVLIGILGCTADILILIKILPMGFVLDAFFVSTHLLYSCGMLFTVSSIFRIHTGLISRNELAYEWKSNDHYIIPKLGENVPVAELTDDEFNSQFENFIYDKSRNVYDKGLITNCRLFWCTPRWDSDQRGEF